MVEVEDRLRQEEVAGAGLAQGDERDRVERREGDALGELVLAAVLLVVGRLHAPQILGEALASEEALAAVVPVAVRDEVADVAVVDRRARSGSSAPPDERDRRELVHLEVELAQLAGHPRVELHIGELTLHVLQHLRRVGRLLVVVLGARAR
jgi:hypothetical protein